MLRAHTSRVQVLKERSARNHARLRHQRCLHHGKDSTRRFTMTNVWLDLYGYVSAGVFLRTY